jgi:hypothetical protein
MLFARPAARALPSPYALDQGMSALQGKRWHPCRKAVLFQVCKR